MTGRKISRRELAGQIGLIAAGVAVGTVGLNVVAPAILPRPRNLDANSSVWADALPPAGPQLTVSGEADVAIVGGGYTGLSAAYYLRRSLPNARVVLLEAARCGSGASGRNGAMLLTTTADRYLIAGQDPALDKRIHDLTVDNITELHRLSTATGVDPEIETRGALHLLRDEDGLRATRHDLERLQHAGIPAEVWDRERTATALGHRAYAGAVLNPVAGQVHPGRLLSLWRHAAYTAGAEIYEHTPVVDISPGEVLTVHTATGHHVRARQVVLATNAYGANIGYLARAAAGVWDYVVCTRPLTDDELDATGWVSGLPYDDDRTEVYYLGLTRDHRVHIGGGPVDYCWNGGLPGADRRRARYDGLRAQLHRLYPALVDVPMEHQWAGLVDMSFDSSPAIGSLGPHRNLHYAIGYSGHGVNLTSVFGRILADIAAGAREKWRWFPYLDRWPPYLPNEPFRWLTIQTDLAIIRAGRG